MEQQERDTRSDEEAEYEDEEVDPRIQVGCRGAGEGSTHFVDDLLVFVGAANAS